MHQRNHETNVSRPRQTSWIRTLRGALSIVAIVMLTTACNGGLRPTLVEVQSTPTPLPLQLNLQPAPEGTTSYPPATANLPDQATADDALIAWADEQGVPYTDACERVTPSPGQLCDIPTGRDTVRLLGPNADEPWYIVRMSLTESLSFGSAYRVVSVDIAGS